MSRKNFNTLVLALGFLAIKRTLSDFPTIDIANERLVISTLYGKVVHYKPQPHTNDKTGHAIFIYRRYEFPKLSQNETKGKLTYKILHLHNKHNFDAFNGMYKGLISRKENTKPTKIDESKKEEFKKKFTQDGFLSYEAQIDIFPTNNSKSELASFESRFTFQNSGKDQTNFWISKSDSDEQKLKETEIENKGKEDFNKSYKKKPGYKYYDYKNFEIFQDKSDIAYIENLFEVRNKLKESGGKDSPDSDKGLGDWIYLIIVGGVLVVALVGILLWYFLIKNKNKKIRKKKSLSN